MIPEMNSDHLVSVVLPFLNAQSTLPRAIDSILDQSYSNFELILIDNGSIDAGAAIAEEYSKMDSRVRLFSEQQKGVVFAANRGISEASGKYIARMDADDFSYSDRLSSQVQWLEDHPDMGGVSGLVAYDGSASNGGFIRYINWLNQVRTVDDVSLNRFVEYPVANPSLMVRSNLFQELGMYGQGDFPEDYEFFLRLQEHGVKIGKTSQVVIEWSDLPTRLTRTHTSYTSEAFYHIKTTYLAKWLAKNNPFHPHVLIWGGGKVAKKRSSLLLKQGICISDHIDVKKSATSIFYQDIRSPDDGFILSYVASWDAREEIRLYLNKMGFIEGKNYLVCS